MRKPVFGVSDMVRHKPGCTATEDGWKLEISDVDRRGIAKTKALISFVADCDVLIHDSAARVNKKSYLPDNIMR